MRVLQHQFDQLKEEMVAKEAALVRENHEQQRILKEKEDLQAEVEKGKEEARAASAKNKEVEKTSQMVNDRNRALQNELDQCKGNLEQALRERSRLNRRLSKLITENKALKLHARSTSTSRKPRE